MIEGEPEKVHYITGEESAVTIIWAQALTDRGVVRWIGDQCGRLYSPDGEVIGGFHRSGHGGWSVSTVPYGGFAYSEEVEIRPCSQGDKCPYAYMHVAQSKRSR